MMTVRWGVLGVGRAGKARAAAIRDDPRAVLVGGYRGDPEGNGMRAFQSLEDMLKHVDAVAICSPDNIHASQVHAALSSYRHVVCEFPLAATAGEASSLFALAVARDRLLHVEHIELLTPSAEWIREFASGKKLLAGRLVFTGGSRRGVSSPAHANISRFQRLIDAVGSPEDVSLERCTPEHLAVKLLFDDEASIDVDCRMGEGYDRHLEMVLEFEEGIVRQLDGEVFLNGEGVELPAAGKLFFRDQCHATAAILDGEEPYIPIERVLEGLALADLVMGAA